MCVCMYYVMLEMKKLQCGDLTCGDSFNVLTVQVLVAGACGESTIDLLEFMLYFLEIFDSSSSMGPLPDPL